MTYRIILLLLAATLSSCTQENLEDCVRGIYLKYYFTMTPDGTNRFEEEVEQMNIYVFDENQRFYEKHLITDPKELLSDNQIHLPLPPGKWYIASWGGSNIDRYNFEKSYRIGTMVDPAQPQFNNELVKGETTLDQFYLLVQVERTPVDEPLDVAQQLAPLFHGKTVQLESNLDSITGATIPMVKNTNVLRVKIGGITNLVTTHAEQNAPFEVYCVMNNGRYDHTNNIDKHARTIKYLQPSFQPHPDTLLTDITVLRLMEQDKTSKLVLESPLLPKGSVEVDIVPAILRYYADVNNQDGLDRRDEFNFEFNFNKNNDNKVNVSIYINGWKVIYIVPEV